MATAELPEMPNGPILELYGQRKRFHVPHGLKPLLEEITTETLRYQPDDIYVFLAQYIDAKLLKTRGPKKSQEIRGHRKSADIDEETEELLDELRLNREDADRYATKIQAAFRGHSTRRSLSSKGKIIHKDHRKSWEWKKWGWEGSSEMEETEVDQMLEEFKVSKDEADKAATKIQAIFRGHRLRKSLEKRGPQISAQKVKEPGESIAVAEPSASEGEEEEATSTVATEEVKSVPEGEEEEDETTEAEAPSEMPPGDEEEMEQSEPETTRSNPEDESTLETDAAPTDNETEEETEAEQPTAEATARGSTAGEETSVFSEGEGEGLTADSTEAEEETEAEG